MPQWVPAQTLSPQALRALAAEQVQPLLESLKSMVAIESGSRDLEGLAQMSEWLAKRLQASGMTVQVLPTQAPADRKSTRLNSSHG